MIVERAAALLAEHGIETARADAEWIVAHVLGVKRSELVALSHKLGALDPEHVGDDPLGVRARRVDAVLREQRGRPIDDHSSARRRSSA